MADPLAPLRHLPRLQLAHHPTPLERMPRLAAHLGLDALWVKRDDCTGLGCGGNKVRKLEYALAAAHEGRADCIVCGGVVQSNTTRQVAAACAKIGIECHLAVMRGRVPIDEPGYEDTGNVLVNRLYGAVVHDIVWQEDRNLQLRNVADNLRAAGRRPYVVPYGASDALGAMGYVIAAEEIVGNCPDVRWIVHSSGSGGTQAGLLAGLLALGNPAQAIGVDVDARPERVGADVRRIGRGAAGMLGIAGRWSDSSVQVAAEWSAGAYGKTDEATDDAIRLAARCEALALDPVYCGKSMAGLIGLAKQGRFSNGGAVVWIHTGGTPAVFAYPNSMARLSR